jgi:nucleotide-binding universal stress UspA family protein
MPSEVILVVLQHPDTAAGLLRTAERLATLTRRASVIALAIRTPPGLVRLKGGRHIPVERLEVVAAQESQRVDALKQAFDDWTAEPRDASVSTLWSDIEGDPGAAVAERGRRADYLVIARPTAGDDWTHQQAFQAALFRTERPVLVVPPGASAAGFGRRIAIAWRDDGQAVKAVLPALRCLAEAERIFLLTGVRDDRGRPAMPEILTEHGVEAEMIVLPVGPGEFGETLLSEAHELEADLLVMGAYAHSPLRELVFGGVTRFMLGHADLPIMMRH